MRLAARSASLLDSVLGRSRVGAQSRRQPGAGTDATPAPRVSRGLLSRARRLQRGEPPCDHGQAEGHRNLQGPSWGSKSASLSPGEMARGTLGHRCTTAACPPLRWEGFSRGLECRRRHSSLPGTPGGPVAHTQPFFSVEGSGARALQLCLSVVGERQPGGGKSQCKGCGSTSAREPHELIRALPSFTGLTGVVCPPGPPSRDRRVTRKPGGWSPALRVPASHSKPGPAPCRAHPHSAAPEGSTGPTPAERRPTPRARPVTRSAPRSPVAHRSGTHPLPPLPPPSRPRRKHNRAGAPPLGGAYGGAGRNHARRGWADRTKPRAGGTAPGEVRGPEVRPLPGLLPSLECADAGPTAPDLQSGAGSARSVRPRCGSRRRERECERTPRGQDVVYTTPCSQGSEGARESAAPSESRLRPGPGFHCPVSGRGGCEASLAPGGRTAAPPSTAPRRSLLGSNPPAQGDANLRQPGRPDSWGRGNDPNPLVPRGLAVPRERRGQASPHTPPAARPPRTARAAAPGRGPPGPRPAAPGSVPHDRRRGARVSPTRPEPPGASSSRVRSTPHRPFPRSALGSRARAGLTRRKRNPKPRRSEGPGGAIAARTVEAPAPKPPALRVEKGRGRSVPADARPKAARLRVARRSPRVVRATSRAAAGGDETARARASAAPRPPERPWPGPGPTGPRGACAAPRDGADPCLRPALPARGPSLAQALPARAGAPNSRAREPSRGRELGRRSPRAWLARGPSLPGTAGPGRCGRPRCPHDARAAGGGVCGRRDTGGAGGPSPKSRLGVAGSRGPARLPQLDVWPEPRVEAVSLRRRREPVSARARLLRESEWIRLRGPRASRARDEPREEEAAGLQEGVGASGLRSERAQQHARARDEVEHVCGSA
ncbi:collagen alpha-1(I) chain-like [Lutra lutra]|uniref:collagen alpha-1(I) chain-like n=1 Tax=Lutra lutra TaxID=9657 RepID=UPI001FD5541C|nr:collagen alpha-1(I) chain-like [Lutra lutra]